MIAECDITSIQKKNYENLQKVLPNYYGLVNKVAVERREWGSDKEVIIIPLINILQKESVHGERTNVSMSALWRHGRIDCIL